MCYRRATCSFHACTSLYHHHHGRVCDRMCDRKTAVQHAAVLCVCFARVRARAICSKTHQMKLTHTHPTAAMAAAAAMLPAESNAPVRPHCYPHIGSHASSWKSAAKRTSTNTQSEPLKSADPIKPETAAYPRAQCALDNIAPAFQSSIIRRAHTVRG